MDDSDSQRIKSLEQSVSRLMSVIEHSTAAQMVLSARLEALQKMVTESLAQLGLESPHHPNLHAALRAMEREACHNQLAAVSDNDPNLATILKTMVDQALQD